MTQPAPQEGLLAGLRVVEMGDEVGARAGRVLADLGAEVVRISPPGDPLMARRSAWLAWTAGKTVLRAAADSPEATRAIDEADVVLDAPLPPSPGTVARRDHLVWVTITPFGTTGPRATWRAGDLGVMAASGNMYVTGSPDRAPVRPSESAAYAHSGGEAAFAALSAIASGRPQHVDLSMQECVFTANMVAIGQYLRAPERGVRRGAHIGRTREIYPTRDGYVSFGLRGGKARQASMELISRLVRDAGIHAPEMEQDWTTWSQLTASDDELAAMERAVAEYFSRHTSQELYELACETNLMLAPANSPKEVYLSAQLESRGFFGALGEVEGFPLEFVTVRSADGHAAPAAPSAPARVVEAFGGWRAPGGAAAGLGRSAPGQGAWHGVRILEFGAGAAGPIATRYFVEQGATVLRVESRSRPDFLRAMAVGPGNPHGLEGAPMYDGLNVSKRNVTLNLKDPRGVAIVRRLVTEWADAISENYAPRAMKGFGLDYDTLAGIKPDLVMLSACLNGQTGPHKDYPGFGGQGSALSGWNWVTGWPDTEPVGPYGTITDSLAPRYVASALAAGLLYRQRTGHGVYLDLAQVQAGLWALSPWLIDYALDGTIGMRTGNRAAGAVPHGAFRCADEGDVGDRWVAVACRSDDEWKTLTGIIGVQDRSLDTLAAREERIDEVERIVEAFTITRTRAEVATMLQRAGIEAVPVADFGDLQDDPQVAARGHFEAMTHPFMGPGHYEHSGIRLSDSPSRYDRPGPTLGQDTEWVLADLLGLGADEIATLEADGVLQ